MAAKLRQGTNVGTMSATVPMPQIPERGLDAQQVAARTRSGRVNRLQTPTSRSIKDIVRTNVFTLFNGIILTAMVLVLLTGSWKDAVFGFVIVVNMAIGIVTELKAKRTLDRLSILVASNYLVRRAGRDVEVAHDGIVLDDLLWIRSGEQVPADALIVRTWGLELDESMLTGESRTVRKSEGERVYSGSAAVSGMALAKVVAVGEHSYAAKLTTQAKAYKKTVSDLNKGINTILRFMTFVVVPLCVLLVWSQVQTFGGWHAALATGAWRKATVSAVAGVVGMIPEGLVLLTSLNFAVAAMRLARRNTLVQELESVETLARVDCLNLDKTGTITDGGIAFGRLIPLDAPDTHLTDSQIKQALFDVSNEGQPNGTGMAILEGLGAQGFTAGRVDGRVPFSSARKWSSIACGDVIWVMGAPEVIVAGLDGDYADLLARVNVEAGAGNRVLLLAVCQGTVPGDYETNPRLDPRAAPVALVTCSERIRADAEDTLAWFRRQGVRCRVISGDNPMTVGAIARRVRLTGDRRPVAMDARELPDDVNELAHVLEGVDVLGRVLPHQKKAIVQALHARNHVVAMTGDGINDALAIKEADLGIAMGNAAPATKAIAQVVLVDSKFSHLPDVVARGRQVMANMERVAGLFLVKTVYSALIALGVVLTQVPFPYQPRHITYIGALTIGMPAFILALAPNGRRYVPGFLRRVVYFALPGGIATGLSVLCAAWFLPAVMGWDVRRSSEQLATLRGVVAIILFMMGVFVLARVSRPLNGWRGVLVVGFAVAGVIGAFVPFVADFFALVVPTGAIVKPTLIALAGSAVSFAVCLGVARRLMPQADTPGGMPSPRTTSDA